MNRKTFLSVTALTGLSAALVAKRGESAPIPKAVEVRPAPVKASASAPAPTSVVEALPAPPTADYAVSAANPLGQIRRRMQE